MQPLPQLPPWCLMWGLALLLYAVAKGATVLAGGLRGVPAGRKMAYLLLFPGMNATEFCMRRRDITATWSAGLRYGVNVLAGVLLLWGGARLVAGHLLVAGWVGMIGLILLLHFGLLQLVSLAWRTAGFDAPPLMHEPVRSASVSEFWSLRWNTAFRELAHRFIFKPFARPAGPRAALLLTFVVSGLIHDLVISLPAGGGYGLPTAYFLLQAAAMQIERTTLGRRWLRQWRGRIFAVAVVAGPAPLLFHPLFLRRVIVPFLVVLGALPKEVLS